MDECAWHGRPRGRARSTVRWLPLVAGLGACVPVLPPVNPGFVSTGTATPGASDVQVQVLGGGLCFQPCSGVVGGALHVDLFASDRVSVPLEASVGYPVTSNLVALPLRIGIRGRLAAGGVAIGGGVGPALTIPTEGGGVSAGAAVDLELALGREIPKGALSAAFRPGYAFTPSDAGFAQAFMLPIELGGIYFPGGPVGIGATVGGGISVYAWEGESDVFGAFTGSLTLVFRNRRGP